MTTLYIHVGVHKTGTTSLQFYLANRRAWLKTQGVTYPAAGIPQSPSHWGHHNLAWGLKEGDPAGIAQAVRAEIETDRAALSSEEFCVLRHAEMFAPLIAAFPGWDLRPVCYIRRQDQLLESVYNHHVKALGETADILDFARKIRRRLDHRNVLGRLEQAFGLSAMTVRLYDKAMIGDTVSDFLSLLDLPYEPIAGLSDINAGLSAEGMQKMLAANREFADDRDRLLGARTRIIHTHSSEKFTQHSMLTDAQRQSLLDEFRPSNREVIDRYFGGNPLLTDGLTYTGT